MKRTIILKYVFVRGIAVSSIDDLAGVMSQWSPEQKLGFARETAEMFAQDIERLKAAGLWADVEENEKTFLQARIDEVSPQERIDASWLAESIACLLWALQIVPELPSYDEEASHELVKMLPATSIRDLAKQAHLRSKMEIEKQRDIAELWHWRSRTRKLQQEGRLHGQLYGGRTIEQIIELSASEGAKNGDLPQPIGSDFPALGKPYRELSAKEFAMLTSIAQERHKAFNWLCGLSPTGRWADTPTDT